MSTEQKILIVDDDPVVRHALRRTFRTSGFEVAVAEDGLQALEHVSSNELPDLIVLDINMPGMDGRDVLTRIKADARTAVVPVVFLTARGDHLSRIQGLELGAAEYFEKPFDLEMLRRRILRLLGKTSKTVH